VLLGHSFLLGWDTDRRETLPGRSGEIGQARSLLDRLRLESLEE